VIAGVAKGKRKEAKCEDIFLQILKCNQCCVLAYLKGFALMACNYDAVNDR
jgi:hypothetical protein